MLRVTVDREEPTLLHEQVAGELRRAIADGEAKPGERLPPARDLAAVLGVNTNTVLRALRQLRDEGLVDFRRGRGVTVIGTGERGVIVAHARELVALARAQGYRVDELVRIIEETAKRQPLDVPAGASRGGHPGGTLTFPRAPVAQGIERSPPERKVAGSIPAGRILTRVPMR